MIWMIFWEDYKKIFLLLLEENSKLGRYFKKIFNIFKNYFEFA